MASNVKNLSNMKMNNLKNGIQTAVFRDTENPRSSCRQKTSQTKRLNYTLIEKEVRLCGFKFFCNVLVPQKSFWAN